MFIRVTCQDGQGGLGWLMVVVPTKTINPHIFGHSIARHSKDQGFSVEFVQKFLGHTSFKTTMECMGL